MSKKYLASIFLLLFFGQQVMSETPCLVEYKNRIKYLNTDMFETDNIIEDTSTSTISQYTDNENGAVILKTGLTAAEVIFVQVYAPFWGLYEAASYSKKSEDLDFSENILRLNSPSKKTRVLAKKEIEEFVNTLMDDVGKKDMDSFILSLTKNKKKNLLCRETENVVELTSKGFEYIKANFNCNTARCFYFKEKGSPELKSVLSNSELATFYRFKYSSISYELFEERVTNYFSNLGYLVISDFE